MTKSGAKFPRGVMFHRFHRQGTPLSGQGSLTEAQFEELLHLVGIENILSPETWLFKLKNNQLQEKDLCLTFDDGLKCQYDICLPVLEKYNLRGFWFIYSSVFEGEVYKSEVYNCFASRFFGNMDEFFEMFFFKCAPGALDILEENEFKNYAHKMLSLFPFYSIADIKFRFLRNRILNKEDFEIIIEAIMFQKHTNLEKIAKDLWMSNEDLRNLSHKGHHIGLHSYSHPNDISALSYGEQVNQYEKNYRHIEETCGKKAISMSHPLNAYNQDTLKILKEIGVECGFCSNTAPPNRREINPTPLELAREDATNLLSRRKYDLRAE